MSTATTGPTGTGPDLGEPAGEPPLPPARPSTGRRALTSLSFTNIGAVYVWIAIIVVFSFWAPDTFPTWSTFQQVLNSNAVTGLVALSVVPPLAARVFDLSLAYTMSLSGVITAKVIVSTDIGAGGAIALAMGTALVIGVINGLVVVTLRVDSFIATLATGSLIQAFITMFTDGTSITGVKLLRESFAGIAQKGAGGFTVPVLYLLLVATWLWFVLEHTATGRRLYATGFNADAARLQGVPTDRLRFLTLVASSAIAGFAGVVFASQIGSGSPEAGTPYLLSSYAAAFVGATQLRAGRFNSWGTVIAVLLLGTGTVGLGLATSAQWAPSLFTGIVLIIALVVTGGRLGLRTRLTRRRAARATQGSEASASGT
ncbi:MULTISPECIES: ABC transporter permease [unclassified Streptomyces]|uniref:ABC transporter permease n=1 Tax=unclassified Streptomyces TaxID=2593676 RepID=UPI002254B9AF|nr:MULTISPECIES: ABC transporter permease [unclassified Streptomyces]MCX5054074.1 ABC transporter permease [Streptomyces sp. NBC_00474]